MIVEPYFMKNEAWYCLNPDEDSYFGYILTEEGKKHPKVVESYDDFYEEEYDEYGNIVDA